MSVQKPTRFTINSQLESVPDTFEMEFPDDGVYATATESERWNLTAGYLDVADQAQVIAQLRDGVVDTWALNVRPNGLTSTLRGRDAAAHLLDTQIRRRFIRAPRPATIEQINVADQEVIEELEGQFRASLIAELICEDAGLSLVWSCEDYTLQEDFEAIGTAISLLRQLANEWSVTEPGRVDIVVDGSAVMVVQRPMVLVAGDTYVVPEDKIREVSVEHSILPRIKRLVLLGQRVPQDNGDFFASGFTKTFTFDNELHVTEGGEIVARVTTTEVRRLPDDLLISQVVRRWQQGVVVVSVAVSVGTTSVSGRVGLVLGSEESLFNDWESSVYDRGVPVNQPQLRGWVKETLAGDAENETLKFVAREECAFSYDSNRFLKAKVVTRLRPDEHGVPQAFQRETESHSDAGPTSNLVTTTLEALSESGRWYVQKTFTSPGQGDRFGGIRPPLAGTRAQLIPIPLIEDDLSADPRAGTLQLDLKHFDLSQLQKVRDRIVAANGLTAHEVTFLTSLPQIRKGQVIALTGVTNAAGSPVPFAPMLVTQVQTRYDESRAAAALTSRITATYWAVTV